MTSSSPSASVIYSSSSKTSSTLCLGVIVSGDYGFGGCLHLGSHQRLIAFLLASGDWKFSSGEGERERAFVTCRIYIVSTYKLNRLFHGKRKGKKKKKGEREKKKGTAIKIQRAWEWRRGPRRMEKQTVKSSPDRFYIPLNQAVRKR